MLAPSTLLFFVLVVFLPLGSRAEEPLKIEEAVRLALRNNERSKIADERVVISEAQLGRARSYFFPTVVLSGTYTRQPDVVRDDVVVRPGSSFQGSASLSMNLFEGSAIPLWRAAVHSSRASSLGRVSERREVAFEAADAFLQTLGAQEVAEAARRRLELAKRTLEDAQTRAKAGLVSSNDVTRAEVELAAADQAAIRAEGDAETSALQLAYLIGVDEPRPLAKREGSWARAATPDAKLIAQSLQRVDVEAAKESELAAAARSEEPLWRWVPSLLLGAQYRTNSTATLLAPQDDWNVTLTLRWVLLDPDRFADRSSSMAEAKIAQLTRQATERQAVLEVRQALLAVQLAEGGVRQADVGVKVARRNAEETKTLYGQGLARAIEVADAALRLFEAEVTLAREEFARDLAWLDLRAATGEDPPGWESTP